MPDLLIINFLVSVSIGLRFNTLNNPQRHFFTKSPHNSFQKIRQKQRKIRGSQYQNNKNNMYRNVLNNICSIQRNMFLLNIIHFCKKLSFFIFYIFLILLILPDIIRLHTPLMRNSEKISKIFLLFYRLMN